MLESLKRMLGTNRQQREHLILAPVSGKAISMSQVKDPVFSQEILGKGAAVIPIEGRVVAPAAGVITMVFDTKHAVSMTTDSGAELIIHIGLDTVKLNGKYFEAHVTAGDRVKPGDLLMEFDREAILAEGYDMTTPVVICNSPNFPKMECKWGMDARAGETPLIQLE